MLIKEISNVFTLVCLILTSSSKCSKFVIWDPFVPSLACRLDTQTLYKYICSQFRVLPYRPLVPTSLLARYIWSKVGAALLAFPANLSASSHCPRLKFATIWLQFHICNNNSKISHSVQWSGVYYPGIIHVYYIIRGWEVCHFSGFYNLVHNRHR